MDLLDVEGLQHRLALATYDYTAACNITAEHQSMTHPVCDFAKHIMQIAYAGTDLWLSDGATNVLPVPPHRGSELTATQIDENRAVMHRAWKLHAEHVRHSLVGEVFDDTATGQGLLNYFLRAVNCGVITEEEALEQPG